MAKGNDGNYLQHSLEVAAATRLAATHPGSRLHVAITHGMAPYERCDTPRPGQTKGLLIRVLQVAQRAAAPGEPKIVSAYRRTAASLSHYPNTAELLRRLVGSAQLTGAIAEVEPAKCTQLRRAWADSRIVVANSSWRRQTDEGGGLTCPAKLDTPWLFTMDPMTYRGGEAADDAYIYQADLPRLTSVLEGYARSGQPGVGLLFVYAVRPPMRPRFWSFADSLSERTGLQMTSYWLTHQGGNRNLAALFWSGVEPSLGPTPEGLNEGR